MNPIPLYSLLLLCNLYATARTYAAAHTDGAKLRSPYTASEIMLITGGLELDGDEQSRTFAAPEWIVTGSLHLVSAGDYLIRGPIHITGGIRGPSIGTALVRFTGSYTITGLVAPNVTLMREKSPGADATNEIPLVNLSIRATLEAGQIITPGFVVGGTQARRVLVRAIGPTLQVFGVSSTIATPVLSVFSGSRQIAQNIGWGGEASLAAVFASVGAFNLPFNSKDSVLLLTLEPGAYTAQVSGGSGEILVEVYLVE